MNRRVLFIDDDPMLLASMDRCLGLQFDVQTALSGPEALRVMELQEEPFAVVVTDMRMPSMDGIQFLKKARELSPETNFLMLTGNQDVQTAAKAINEGDVSRFLNKPCDLSDIATAIETCLQRHEDETSQRELHDKTVLGAIEAFCDMMETLRPGFEGRAEQVQQLAERIQRTCQIDECWDYQIAARLSLLGFAIRPEGSPVAPATPQASQRLADACDTASRLIQRIPRLKTVAEIIRTLPESDGSLPPATHQHAGDPVPTGAAIVRVAQLVEGLSHHGVSNEQATSDLKTALPNASERLIAAALKAFLTEPRSGDAPATPSRASHGIELVGT